MEKKTCVRKIQNRNMVQYLPFKGPESPAMYDVRKARGRGVPASMITHDPARIIHEILVGGFNTPEKY